MKKNYFFTNEFALVFAFLLSLNVCAQQTVTMPYTEDFTDQKNKGHIGLDDSDSIVSDFEGVTWNIEIVAGSLLENGDYLKVKNDALEAKDVNEPAIWKSPIIDISSEDKVMFSLQAGESGKFEEDDYFKTEYRVGGTTGTWIQASTNGYLLDDMVVPNETAPQYLTVSQYGISGQTLEIRVTLFNNAATEKYFIDNVQVVADTLTLSNTEVQNRKLQLSPNPTSTGFIHIEGINPSNASVLMYKITGSQVLATSLTGTTLDVSTLNAGVYILKITQDGATITKKLVIK